MTHIRTEVEAGVGVLTIHRPERFNALDVETAQDLRRAGLQLARDRAVRAVVLRGCPGMFCSGADLKFIRAGGDPEQLRYLSPAARPVRPGYGEVFKQILEYLHSTISEIRAAPKPFLAAVDGSCAAGGFGLAMACDLVFASERATFEWAYAKTGLSGAESSTFLLPRLVGLRFALELALLGQRLDARAAQAARLVTGVFPVEGFDAEVLGVARRLAAGPTRAFAAAKALLNEAAGVERLGYHLDRELENLVRSADGPEFAEGIDAFFAKRPPRFPEP
ncbi:MAG TPA: enoyl-CoA hydratase-related protein [Myxococcaceae bacterium]|jgi:2-(1,2-epoxy-1,2-dihydrophenyl)acetyl-CoA isomerase|nr:enoyl-CoA hydratase-related protein [Myxococcaceae bacterium]